MNRLQQAALVLALLLGTVLTGVISLNLRYKALHLGGTNATPGYVYLDTWTGVQTTCLVAGRSRVLCVKGVEITQEY